MTDALTREERHALLGPAAVAAAHELAAQAPPWSPEMHRALEALLRRRDAGDNGGTAQGEPMEQAS